MSALRQYALEELQRAGMLSVKPGDVYDEYNEMCAKAVLELMDVFTEQGHSGFSASMVLGMFNEVANWRPLTPLTDGPEEWHEVGENMWQNRRRPDAFSEDGGHTYYLLDECRRGWRRKLLGQYRKFYKTEKHND